MNGQCKKYCVPNLAPPPLVYCIPKTQWPCYLDFHLHGVKSHYSLHHHCSQVIWNCHMTCLSQILQVGFTASLITIASCYLKLKVLILALLSMSIFLLKMPKFWTNVAVHCFISGKMRFLLTCLYAWVTMLLLICTSSLVMSSIGECLSTIQETQMKMHMVRDRHFLFVVVYSRSLVLKVPFLLSICR